MPEANIDIPALSDDESAQSSGNMADTSISESRPSTLPSLSQPIKNFTQPIPPNNLQLQQLQLQQQEQIQQQINQQQPAFMDQSFFYGLDQLASENPLFFMQQQQHQQQQIQQHQLHLQQQTTSLFENQFLKKATGNENAASSSSINESGGPMNDSSTTLAQSIATSMESFQAAVTTSVGEQPPTFWTGLNNVCIFNYIIRGM